METWNDGVFGESTKWSIQSDYGGWFHVYAFTMTMGVMIAIGCAAYQFWKKGLKVDRLMYGAMGAVPAGLLGGSFFGKIGSGLPFFENFAFWEAGMSIHGAILFGATFGILVFYIIGRWEKVSVLVYMDFILPHILLSQALGRWGNFFNHEIIGKPVGLYDDGAMSWLPAFIRDNVTFRFNGATGTIINSITLQNGLDYVVHPIFLYESFSFVVLWAVIMFLIPLVKYCTKNVPWKLDPQAFPVRKTALPLEQIKSNPLFEPKAYKVIKKDEQELYYLKITDIWKKAFYFNVDLQAIENYKMQIVTLDKEMSSKLQANAQKPKIKRYFSDYSAVLVNKYKTGRALNYSNNPHNYHVLRAGVQAGGYFFFWNLVRFILETQRPVNNLFIKDKHVLSVTLIALTALAGLIFMILSQWVSPYFCRKPGFIYEKEFVLLKEQTTNKEKSQKQKVKQKTENDKLKSKEQKAKEKLDRILKKNN